MLVVANLKTLIYLLPKILKFDWKGSFTRWLPLKKALFTQKFPFK